MSLVVSDDFLDEMISERTKVNPAFPQLLDAAIARRRLQEDPTAVGDGAGEGQDP